MKTLGFVTRYKWQLITAHLADRPMKGCRSQWTEEAARDWVEVGAWSSWMTCVHGSEPGSGVWAWSFIKLSGDDSCREVGTRIPSYRSR